MEPTARHNYSISWISERPQMQTSIRWWWQHSSSTQHKTQIWWDCHQIQGIIQDLQIPQLYPKPSLRPNWESREPIEESAIQLSLITITFRSVGRIIFIIRHSTPGSNRSIQTSWWTWLVWDLRQQRVHQPLEITQPSAVEESRRLIAQRIHCTRHMERSTPEANSQMVVDPSEEMMVVVLIRAASKTTA